VTIDREGRPVIRYRPGAQERELLRRGIVAAARVHVAAGAERVNTLHERDHGFDVAGKASADIERCLDQLGRAAVDRNWAPIFSAHQMGTCRIGRDPRDAACDETGNVFGVRGLYVADASAFPASSGVNPMISILALARLLASRIVAQT
jgi:choline dehydrogenase-like flavoprotein